MKPIDIIKMSHREKELNDDIRTELFDIVPEDIHKYQAEYTTKFRIMFYQWLNDNVENIEFKSGSNEQCTA